MPIPSRYLAALKKLFRHRPVAQLDDLRQALNTPSRTTIFRVLQAVGYRTSYSHAGRYYTLSRIPQFDSHGLWRYRDIGFSAQGTLRSTVVYLVNSSPAGQTHHELQDLLHLRVHDTLRLLVESRETETGPLPRHLPVPKRETRSRRSAVGSAATTGFARFGGTGPFSHHRHSRRCPPSSRGRCSGSMPAITELGSHLDTGSGGNRFHPL